MLLRLLCLADWLRHRWRSRHEAPHLAVGRRGEDLAHRYLQRQGYTVVARNYRIPGQVELDIVAWDGPTLVFVEVKTRTSSEFGTPDRAIGREKREHLFRAAAAYLKQARVDWKAVRFDIVNVTLGERPVIEHLKDVYPVLTRT